MIKYIAFLRGVNVGGKNKIPMPELKRVFEKQGFLDVRTYINSGNILFSSDSNVVLSLQKKCRRAIFDAFHVDIPVAIISADDLKEALSHAPKWWDNDINSKHNAIIVIAPASSAAVIKAVGEAKPEYEKVFCHGQVIFWSAPINTFSRTRWSKVASTAVYSDITIRNVNTTKKLLALSLG